MQSFGGQSWDAHSFKDQHETSVIELFFSLSDPIIKAYIPNTFFLWTQLAR